MSAKGWEEMLRPWLRETHGPAFDAALEWLLPRCRTEEERILAPTLLLMLSPFNALVAPCRPAAESRVNFQVTLSRQGAAGPERVRLTVRAGSGVREGGSDIEEMEGLVCPEFFLDSRTVTTDPLGSAARVIEVLLPS